MSQKFKPLQQVYCPLLGNELYTLRRSVSPCSPPLHLKDDKGHFYYFDEQGRYDGVGLPMLFSAHFHDCGALSALWGVPFAQSTPKSNSKPKQQVSTTFSP